MNEETSVPIPRRRATNADREHITQILSQALSDGQLDYAEFDERSKSAWSSTHRDELDPLVLDLVDPAQIWESHSPLPEVRMGSSISNRARGMIEPGTDGNNFSFALMSGSDLKGDWKIAEQHTSLALMGGNHLDLRKARLSAEKTTIQAWACMGGIVIVVPEDVRVESKGFGLMGGYAIRDHDSVTVRQADLPPDVPLISISGLALMGAVDIVRAPRGVPL